MSSHQAGVVEFFAEIKNVLSKTETMYLPEPLDTEVSDLLANNKAVIAQLTLEEQAQFLELMHTNLGLFISCLGFLSDFPGPLKYAYVSKAMYEMGACGMPEQFVPDVEKLLVAVPSSFWTEISTQDAIYNFREYVVMNPAVGKEPLEDEFFNCGDISLLVSILRNPICPQWLVESITNKSHFVFDEYDEEELEDLIATAEEWAN